MPSPATATDEDLLRRARSLSHRFLGGLAQPASVRWVTNQQSRWASCTPDRGTIRVSDRLRRMPAWVLDYVLIHELVHLWEPDHGEEFWAWVSRYPDTDRARGYLAGWLDGVEGGASAVSAAPPLQP